MYLIHLLVKLMKNKKKLKRAIEQLKEGEYYHIYMPGFTMEKVNALANKFKKSV